jgi:hypothetical protein
MAGARGDHKIIAYAIANCEEFRKNFGDIDTMPRRVFSALLLDLTPLGEHKFSTSTSDEDPKPKPIAEHGPTNSNVGAGSPSPEPITLEDTSIQPTSYEEAILFLSDKIARARLAVASAASSNYPQMRLLGWITVGISATATLFVTIKSSMTAPTASEVSVGKLRRFVFIFVGLLAMILSAAVTALTSIKQFYDPLTAYRASEVALVGLQQLHNKVAFDFVRTWDVTKCKGGADKDDFWKGPLQTSAQELAHLEAVAVMATANLQDSDLARLATGPREPGSSSEANPTK